MTDEINNKKKEADELCIKPGEEKLTDKSTVSASQKAININRTELFRAKAFMHRWPVLIIAVLTSVISLITLIRLILHLDLIVSAETLFILPTEIIATAGLWRAFSAGASAREDIDVSKRVGLIKCAFVIAKVCTFIVISLAFAGIVFIILAAEGFFGETLQLKTPVSVKLDLLSVCTVLLVCVLAITAVSLFFSHTGRMIGSIANMAKNGKKYSFNSTVLAAVSAVIGLAEIIAAFLIRANAEALYETFTGFTEEVDWTLLFDAPSFIIALLSGAVFIFVGIQALYYKRIQTKIPAENDPN